MAKIYWDGAALLSPVPAALVSCGTPERPNVLTVAWTGIISSKPPRTYVSVRPERFSHGLISETGEFVVNLPPRALLKAVDTCGVLSGRNTDKLSKCGLTAESSRRVSAPSIAECPISLECKVFEIKRLGSHDMFLADIVGVSADDRFIDKKGRLDINKCDLLCYAHGAYFGLTEPLGTFGFSVRKKPLKRRSK